mmetsp:Transcript_65376/g.108623  ORF Transcript_65376/g.108623 Transcript_65376/m.108623 type:complete len:178 (-) Transcript_65376:1446-1979(-)
MHCFIDSLINLNDDTFGTSIAQDRSVHAHAQVRCSELYASAYNAIAICDPSSHTSPQIVHLPHYCVLGTTHAAAWIAERCLVSSLNTSRPSALLKPDHQSGDTLKPIEMRSSPFVHEGRTACSIDAGKSISIPRFARLSANVTSRGLFVPSAISPRVVSGNTNAPFKRSASPGGGCA